MDSARPVHNWRTGMAYSDIRGRQRLSQWWSLARYKLENRDRFAEVKYRSFASLRRELEAQLGPLEGCTLYEIGCGQWCANVYLFEALEAKVVAVDPELPPRSPWGYVPFAFRVGPQRAVKTALNEALLRHRFNAQLEERLGRPLRPPRGQLFAAGAEHIPLPDESVDAVFSDDVYEHLPDVDAATAEAARVLKPGGIALIRIHPFTAFSGGHHPASIHHGQRRELTIPPWDHLRQRRHPSGVYLNELRERDYRRILRTYFETLRWERLGPEGEEHLTDAILQELPDYDRDELLVGKIVFLGRKPASNGTSVSAVGSA